MSERERESWLAQLRGGILLNFGVILLPWEEREREKERAQQTLAEESQGGRKMKMHSHS